MTDIKDGVAAVQPRLCRVGRKSISGGRAIGCLPTTLPGRVAVDGVAVSIVSAELHAVGQLFSHGNLQAVVNRVGRILPNSQTTKIWIQRPERIDFEAAGNGMGIDLAT